MGKIKKWLDVVNYAGLYKVSEDGDVYSVEREIGTNGIGRRKVGGIKRQNETYEYKTVKLSKAGVKKRYFVHTLVCMAFHCKDHFDGAVVNHKDGNKFNNNYKNLEWVTIGDNQKHAYDNNLRKKILGENNHHAKLNESKVLKIYEMRFTNKISYQEIANEMKVSKRAIVCVCKGISWNDVYEKNKSKIS